MKKSFSFFSLAALLPLTLFAEAPQKSSEGETVAVVAPQVVARENTSLVKVNATQQPWNYRIPWEKVSPTGKRGLGVVLEGNHVLVTAQIVADATYIELEQADSGRKLAAKVEAVDYEANLALLAPNEQPEGFFDGLKPISIDAGAHQGDVLELWQLGGRGEPIVSQIAISKVQVARYFLESSLFLVYETNGIIRSEANSFTVPVMRNGKLSGLLLRYNSKDQVATVLPAPIISHFLKDYATGHYQGFPSLGIEFHQTLDRQFREYIGLKPGQGGVFVGSVSKGGSAEQIGIQANDVVLEMDGKRIDSRGDYQDEQYGTLSSSHLVRGKAFIGDELSVKLLRDGKEMTLSGKLIRKAPKDFLVWPYLFDHGPNYLVQAGLIFQDLSVPYLQSFGEDWENSAPLRLVYIAKHPDDFEKQGRRKVIILGGTLPTRTTQGYERLGGLIVTKVNDKPINDLKDLDEAFKSPQDNLHKIQFEDFPRIIYIDAFTSSTDNMRLENGAYRITRLKRLD